MGRRFRPNRAGARGDSRGGSGARNWRGIGRKNVREFDLQDRKKVGENRVRARGGSEEFLKSEKFWSIS